MIPDQFKQASSQLLSDTSFNQLEEHIQQPNIFNILNLGNYEIRHSSFLAWLLNPNETHQARDFFLKRFLEDLIKEKPNSLEQSEIDELNIKQVDVKREWQNIDLLVITPKFVVCIENKMWSEEHSNQLQRYKEIVESYFPLHNKVYVFLSPYGKASSMKEEYIPYPYRNIKNIISDLLKEKSDKLAPAVQSHLKDYHRLIEQNIMGKDKTAEELAKELYKKHHQLFDFISQNRGDGLKELENKILQKLLQSDKETAPYVLGSKSSGYVRFLPRELVDVIATYPNAAGWPLKEAFLFEFEIKPNTIRFKATTYRPKKELTYLAFDQKLHEVLEPKKEPTNDWFVYAWNDWFWDVDFNHKTWDKTTDDRLDEILEAAKVLIRGITEKILEHKDQFVTLKKEIETK